MYIIIKAVIAKNTLDTFWMNCKISSPRNVSLWSVQMIGCNKIKSVTGIT